MDSLTHAMDNVLQSREVHGIGSVPLHSPSMLYLQTMVAQLTYTRENLKKDVKVGDQDREINQTRFTSTVSRNTVVQ